MICNTCASIIPEAVLRCPSCNAFIGKKSDRRVPHCDKYGNDITVLKPEFQKENIRDDYFMSRYYYAIACSSNEDERKKEVLKLKIEIILSVIFAIFFTVLLLIICSTNNDGGEITLPIFIVSFILICGIICLYIFKYKAIEKKHITLPIPQEVIDKHTIESSLTYYSDKVFGRVFESSVITDEHGHRTVYYEYVEYDKANFTNIKYNTDFADYTISTDCLILPKPRAHPTKALIIEDIYDDTELSIALGLDLPAKDIIFKKQKVVQ